MSINERSSLRPDPEPTSVIPLSKAVRSANVGQIRQATPVDIDLRTFPQKNGPIPPYTIVANSAPPHPD
jgi:hypothetical protein